MDIWFEVRSYSSVFKEVSIDINYSDAVSSGSTAVGRFRRYCVTESDQKTNNCMGGLKSTSLSNILQGGVLFANGIPQLSGDFPNTGASFC